MSVLTCFVVILGPMHVNWAIFRRWCDILVYSVVGAAAAFLLNTTLVSCASATEGFFGAWSFLGIEAVLTVFIALCTALLHQLRGMPAISPSLLFRYPPTWFAAVISCFFCFLVAIFSHSRAFALGYSASIWTWLVVTVTAGMVAFRGTAKIMSSLVNLSAARHDPGLRRRVSNAENTLEGLAGDVEDLSRWIAREEPIDKPDDDRFGIAAAANRTARQLFNDQPIKTFGLVGPWGSGKTSFCRLVRHYLKFLARDPESCRHAKYVWTCEVGAWGLDSGPSAPQHVLTAVVNELAKHVDCLALSGLPERYREALSGGDGLLIRTFGALFCVRDDPVELLQSLDRILQAVEARLVIFVEDIDRNANPSALVVQIESLLDRLRHLENVSFVLAASENDRPGIEPIDFARLCDRVDVLRPLPPQLVRRVMSTFRDDRLSFAKSQGDIDPIPPESREIPDSIPEMMWRMPGYARVRFPLWDAVACLGTPRVLKSALRRVTEAWQELHGEIDFDHLLAVSILRSGAPKAYNFLVTNIARIRSFDPEPQRQSEEHKSWTTQRGQLLKEIGAVRYAESLVCYLFPVLAGTVKLPNRIPQGVGETNPTDYWARLNNEAIDDPPRDQEVLRALRDWRSHTDARTALIGKLANDSSFTDKFEHFGKLGLANAINLQAADVLSLASDLFADVLNEHGAAANEESAPGFIALWRVSLQKPYVGHPGWVKSAIGSALPRSVRFADSIFYFWGSSERKPQDRAQLLDVHSHFLEVAKLLFDGKANELIHALDPAFPYSLYQMAFPPNLQQAGMVEPVSIPWLGATLLKEASLNPQLMAPEIGFLLSEVKHEVGPPKHGERPMARQQFKLVVDRLPLFFPNLDEQRAVLEFLANTVEGPPLSAPSRDMLETISVQARDELKGRTGGKK
jgi:KAP-like P-loop domain-containing protein